MKDRISKVGFKEGAVIIKTTRINPGADEKRTEHKSYRVPHMDFFAAFGALEQHVRDLLEWPSNLYKDRVKLTGVSWSFSEGTDVEGAVITGQAALEGADAPLCFNTPHLAFEQYSEGGKAKLMPEECIDALEELRREAAEFLDGKKAPNPQNDLFPDDEATVVSGKDAAAGEGRDLVDEVGEVISDAVAGAHSNVVSLSDRRDGETR